MEPELRDDEVAAVLVRLGLPKAPAPDLAGLREIYRAWCRNVPFDNTLKRLHLVAHKTGALPGGEPTEFFENLVRFGTGGTCWPTSGALYALLHALGFPSRRASAAMQDQHIGPTHNHGTVIVTIDRSDFLVDSSMLFEEPLPLRPGEAAERADPMHPLRVEPVGALWRLHWRSPSAQNPMTCLMLDDDVDHRHYLARYEASRRESPFNLRIYARRNFADGVVGVSEGARFRMGPTGLVDTEPLNHAGLVRVLVDEIGIDEELAQRLPADQRHR